MCTFACSGLYSALALYAHTFGDGRLGVGLRLALVDETPGDSAAHDFSFHVFILQRQIHGEGAGAG